jgi:hypothetical protein
MTGLGTIDRLLVAAAAYGELEYRNATAATRLFRWNGCDGDDERLFRWNGADVDGETSTRIAALIADRYLRVSVLNAAGLVQVTPAGRAALAVIDTAVVYCTDDPQLVGIYRRALAARAALAARLAADLQALGAGPEIYGQPGGRGFPEELTAIGQRGRHVPAGWTAAGHGRLRPIAGPGGDIARHWLAEHRPPDPRHEFAAYGLPRQVWIPVAGEPGEYEITQVELTEHDGVLWARYPAEPGGRSDFYDQACSWQRRDPSEHPTATAGSTPVLQATGVDAVSSRSGSRIPWRLRDRQ